MCVQASSEAPGWVGAHIEMLVLRVIALGDCYGYSIGRALSQITGGGCRMKETTLYACLRRLEAEGLVAPYWGSESQGSRRKYYALTQRGREAFSQHAQRWAHTKALVDQILAYEGPLPTKGEQL